MSEEEPTRVMTRFIYFSIFFARWNYAERENQIRINAEKKRKTFLSSLARDSKLAMQISQLSSRVVLRLLINKSDNSDLITD